MVKRYDNHWEYGMSMDDDGEWVSYDDYEALQAENARLREVVEELDRFRSMARWVSNCAGHSINSGMRAKGEELLVLINAAKGGEQIADIVADWDANRCGPFKAMKRIKKHLDSLTFQPGNDLHIGYEAGMKLARRATSAIDLGQFRETIERLWKASHVGSEDDLSLGKLLALIDGQASKQPSKGEGE